MEQAKIDAFVKKYEYLYFNPNSMDNDFKQKYYHKISVTQDDYIDALQKVGIKGIKSTHFNVEKQIMNLLENNQYNHIALAWKAGKLEWDDAKGWLNIKQFDSRKECFNGYRAHIDKKGFDAYCIELEKKRDSINNYIDNLDWKEAYDIARINTPNGIGPVNIINAMYFISGGKAPIYDSFVHKATRSLLLGIAPCHVYMGFNPDKKEVDNVVLMYCEYMMLLKKLFDGIIRKNNIYIPRKLDRALWVYGHASRMYITMQ